MRCVGFLQQRKGMGTKLLVLGKPLRGSELCLLLGLSKLFLTPFHPLRSPLLSVSCDLFFSPSDIFKAYVQDVPLQKPLDLGSPLSNICFVKPACLSWSSLGTAPRAHTDLMLPWLCLYQEQQYEGSDRECLMENFEWLKVFLGWNWCCPAQS